MKCGIPPIRALQEAGVRIGLGCDNCSCSDAQNMFVAMKLYALLARSAIRSRPAAGRQCAAGGDEAGAKARGSGMRSAASRRATRPTSH